jgi:hypothetical protein
VAAYRPGACEPHQAHDALAAARASARDTECRATTAATVVDREERRRHHILGLPVAAQVHRHCKQIVCAQVEHIPQAGRIPGVAERQEQLFGVPGS